jgi:diacylglycerol kinase family enzyme
MRMTNTVQAVGQRHAYRFAMRVCLYWNPGAGDQVPRDHITRAIRDAGHEVAGVLRHKEDVTTALDMHVDALAVAGGDGTVGRAARALAGRNLPIAILPLGTANNIANSLAIAADPLAAIAAWRDQKIVKIDVGTVTDEHGERIFIEGTGTGLVPRGITNGKGKRRDHDDAGEELDWARNVFLDALSEIQPQHSRLCVDGEEVAGDYLLVEVLNIAAVGPRLKLSPEITPADGLLSVVIAVDTDRDAIRAHLQQPAENRDDHAWLKSWRATRVEISGWHEYHVDDEVLSSTSGKLTITIQPSSLPVLA